MLNKVGSLPLFTNQICTTEMANIILSLQFKRRTMTPHQPFKRSSIPRAFNRSITVALIAHLRAPEQAKPAVLLSTVISHLPRMYLWSSHSRLNFDCLKFVNRPVSACSCYVNTSVCRAYCSNIIRSSF
jgi:hypothetical protein